MRFRTKLWQRSRQSFATTIPQALLFLLDPSKKYNVEWVYDIKHKLWSIDFIETNKKTKQEKAKFSTILWKRSQRSYATTVPHAVLLHINEDKKHELEWEFNKKLEKWTITLKEGGK